MKLVITGILKMPATKLTDSELQALVGGRRGSGVGGWGGGCVGRS